MFYFHLNMFLLLAFHLLHQSCHIFLPLSCIFLHSSWRFCFRLFICYIYLFISFFHNLVIFFLPSWHVFAFGFSFVTSILFLFAFNWSFLHPSCHFCLDNFCIHLLIKIISLSLSLCVILIFNWSCRTCIQQYMVHSYAIKPFFIEVLR